MCEELPITKKSALVGVVIEHIQAEIDCDLARTMETMADEPHLLAVKAQSCYGCCCF
ncbi:MAG: hypothetical protein F2894_05230 [Actinobacteria bacterium]|uniref:Unannotated protein n=1 Tax=freshwater metagenome TaxID=449393 RepID=A0A6J7QG55_9ZZZZ|nr:hypothetical protein [Actinomycetota bacterium]MSW05594.1 hypothetical protein [Actinomycetota bacterium]MSX32239.1 hypothetical protein [Actinomycetota bacterium]MSX81725.1 hypothetical protein [Actinomycetota bacterium]